MTVPSGRLHKVALTPLISVLVVRDWGNRAGAAPTSPPYP